MAITRNIIGIGRSIGMEVVAEGVEHAEQARLLAANDCHIIQGYLFSKPLLSEGKADGGKRTKERICKCA